MNGTTGVARRRFGEGVIERCRLINISTRAQVGTGANLLIPGFVITGNASEPLLVRADGPGLSQFNVSGVLSQPSLSVFNNSATVVASNSGWGNSSNPTGIASTASLVGAFALSAGSGDSAQVLSLTPGAYTMQVSGVGSTRSCVALWHDGLRRCHKN